MARRRRYDTEALVGQLRADRRTSIILTVAGIGILLLLVSMYMAGIGSDDGEDEKGAKKPKVTATSATPAAGTTASTGTTGSTGTTAAAGAGSAAGEPVTAKAEPEPEPEPEPPSGPAKVNLVLQKKGTVWLGKKKLGKFKQKEIEVPVGTHVLKAKVGGKTVKHTLEIKGGETVALKVELKKKKLVVSEGE